MQITLTQTGGHFGLTRTASVTWTLSADEYKALVRSIKLTGRADTKDGYSYFISSDASAKEAPISITHIEERYRALFDKLLEKLA